MKTSGYSNIIRWCITLGVIVVLLRPFVVYELTAKLRLETEPSRAWSLLQRLVKKKEEHQEANAGIVIMENIYRNLPRILRPLLAVALFLLPFLKLKNKPFSLPQTISLPVQRYRYRLLSCWLI